MRFPTPIAALLLATLSTAQDAPLASGPLAGADVPALPVYAPAGPDGGLELDLADVIGPGPGAVLFVHELTRNVAPLVRGLDELTDRYRVLGLTGAIVMLADDRTAAERHAAGASESLRLTRPMFVSTDGAEGPGAWALNRRCSLTLVLTDAGKIVESVAFTDAGAQDLPRLRELVERVTGPLPRTPGELRQAALAALPEDPEVLRARAAHLLLELHWQAGMRAKEREGRQPGRQRMAGRGMQAERDARAERRRAAAERPGTAERDAAERRGAAPSDPELQALLRRAIRRDASTEDLDAVFAAIDARVADDADLRRQAIGMFELMLGLDYGNEDARGRARAWLDSAHKRR